MILKKSEFLGGKTQFFPDPNVIWVSDHIHPWDGTQKAEVGIIGIPFDGGTASHRRGARLGPKGVREALNDYTTFNLDLDVDISEVEIVDFGDVECLLNDYDETHRRVEEVLTRIFDVGIIPIIIGGDHSVTYPCIKALQKSMRDQRLGVIDFDTHHDIREGWAENSGLWVREIQALDNSPIKGENIVQIGIHGFYYSQFYRNEIQKMGITVIKPEDIRRLGIEAILEEAFDQASDGTDGVYVSVDIDVIDQTFAPGTSSPRPGGMMPWDVVSGMVKAGKHVLVKALDIMEISPPLDINGVTTRLGAELLMQFISGIILRK
jgi:formimidoylglutamase